MLITADISASLNHASKVSILFHTVSICIHYIKSLRESKKGSQTSLKDFTSHLSLHHLHVSQFLSYQLPLNKGHFWALPGIKCFHNLLQNSMDVCHSILSFSDTNLLYSFAWEEREGRGKEMGRDEGGREGWRERERRGEKERERGRERERDVVAAHTLILAFGRQTQVKVCEFKASLIYAVSSRTARTL